jgi:hypothetical protein
MVHVAWINGTHRISYADPSGRAAWVCGRSLAEIAGLNPAGVLDVCFL